MIGIINYGSGNIHAIGNIYKNLNIEFKIITQPEDFNDVDHLILPGVGSFDFNMTKLNESGLRSVLDYKVLVEKIPVFGICIGLHIMLEESEEGDLPGLGWIKGKVRKFDESQITVKPKVPHMGWNSVNVMTETNLYHGIDTEKGFYFIHSYYADISHTDDVMTTTNYGTDFVSAIRKNNIYATQYHPEKSHGNGMQLLKNFSETLC